MFIIKSYNEKTEQVQIIENCALEEDGFEAANEYEEYLNKCGVEYVRENCHFLENSKVVRGILFTLNSFVELENK